MILFLKDQHKKLCNYLPKFKQSQVMPYDISKLKEKKNTASIPCNKELKQLSFNFLFNYNVFPEDILIHCTEWEYSKRSIQKEDTIVQQIYFPPFKKFSKKIVVGVRVKEVWKEDNLIGFSYETLKGHIEKGVSCFQVRKSGDQIDFIIKTYSRADNFILDLLSPLFSSPYQDYCTRKALTNIIKEFKNENRI